MFYCLRRQGADVVSKVVNKCMKEYHTLESKCELARGKVDLNKAKIKGMWPVGGHLWQGCIPCILDLCMDQAIPSNPHLRVNI